MIEDAARRFLRDHGYNCIEKIYTGCVFLRGKWTPVKKVSGDFKAISKAGKAVHVEVKCRQDKLCYSDFERHQVDALNDISQANGESLVIWSQNPYEIVLLRWPIEGFGPRKSISWEQAKIIAEQ